jgi:hypothetical protein
VVESQFAAAMVTAMRPGAMVSSQRAARALTRLSSAITLKLDEKVQQGFGRDVIEVAFALIRPANGDLDLDGAGEARRFLQLHFPRSFLEPRQVSPRAAHALAMGAPKGIGRGRDRGQERRHCRRAPDNARR